MKQRILHHGQLQFTAFEEGQGTTVFLLHGFPDHARSFRLQMPALAKAGYRAISPMMRGYEPSSEPQVGNYELSSIAKDITAFIDELDVGKVHLVGHDWGAVIAYIVAANAPEKLLSLTTLAVPHPGRLLREVWFKRPGQLINSWYMLFFQLRGVAEFVLERRDWAFVQWLWQQWSPGWKLSEVEWSALKSTFAQPGVKHSALQYYRSLMLPRSLPELKMTMQAVNKPIHVPTLAITGARDRCMDTRLHSDLMRPSDFPRGLIVERIQDAGHFVHQEQPDAVNRLLLKHFDNLRPSL